jgi:hypothetical protein
VNRAIHPAPAQQRLVRGIDDGIDWQSGDIGTYGTESGRHFQILRFSVADVPILE